LLVGNISFSNDSVRFKVAVEDGQPLHAPCKTTFFVNFIMNEAIFPPSAAAWLWFYVFIKKMSEFCAGNTF
jgi:hypothetical protein